MPARDKLMEEYWRVTQEIDKLEGDLKLDTYAAPHVWNLVAKTLREYNTFLLVQDPDMLPETLDECRAIQNIALLFAKRFTRDAGFDPIKWLDQCSPDPERYPISELWEESK